MAYVIQKLFALERLAEHLQAMTKYKTTDKMSPMILFLTLPLCYWQEKALPILLVFLWTPAVSDLLINM